MYKYYIQTKSYINNIQTLVDFLELKGKFDRIPELLQLKSKLEELKYLFYNEEIDDNEIVSKFEELEKTYKELI